MSGVVSYLFGGQPAGDPAVVLGEVASEERARNRSPSAFALVEAGLRAIIITAKLTGAGELRSTLPHLKLILVNRTKTEEKKAESAGLAFESPGALHIGWLFKPVDWQPLEFLGARLEWAEDPTHSDSSFRAELAISFAR